MNQYIITEEEIDKLAFGQCCDFELICSTILSRPYNEQSIRQDATEKVLEALKEDLRDRFISSSNQWSKGRNSGLVECCNIIDEELRKGEQG